MSERAYTLKEIDYMRILLRVRRSAQVRGGLYGKVDHNVEGELRTLVEARVGPLELEERCLEGLRHWIVEVAPDRFTEYEARILEHRP